MKSSHISSWISISLIILLGGLNIFQWDQAHSSKADADDERRISQIHNYLAGIAPDFIQDIQALATTNNLPSWGCGPSSYALAILLNKKFFDNQLSIDVLYDNNPYEIIERFGFVRFEKDGRTITGDHAWIEIFLKDKLIFIDPTIAQYGKSDTIAFEIFSVGDPNIKTVLKEKYGIIDDRISILVRKVQRGIPINDPPYPGMGIDPNYLEYFQKIAKTRDTVSLGQEPDSWKPWVADLVQQYDI